MKSVNTVILLGNATRDAELKNTKAGQSVCTFGLATNRFRKLENGEKEELPEFHSLVAWGALAELCAKTVKKGKPLYVEGYIKTSSWEGKAKEKMQRTEVIVEELVLLGAKTAANGQSEA